VGLFDTLFGRRKLPATLADRLGQISSAEQAIRDELGYDPSGSAGIAVKSVSASSFEQVAGEVEKMLRLAGEDLGSRVRTERDGHGYLWMIVDDPDFTDVVAETQVAAQTLKEEGYGEQLLAGVFPFTPQRGASGPLYLIYGFKRGTFYAFCPQPGQQRDLAVELRVHAVLAHELPLEADLGFRYPMWGMPL
jgi:hypothetical protein